MIFQHHCFFNPGGGAFLANSMAVIFLRILFVHHTVVESIETWYGLVICIYACKSEMKKKNILNAFANNAAFSWCSSSSIFFAKWTLVDFSRFLDKNLPKCVLFPPTNFSFQDHYLNFQDH